MEDMLWIEDIVKSTPAFPFLTTLKIDIISFVDLTKWLVERRHFQPFQVYEIRVKSKDGVENKELKHQFSQMKGDLYLQNLDPKPLDPLLVP